MILNEIDNRVRVLRFNNAYVWRAVKLGAEARDIPPEKYIEQLMFLHGRLLEIADNALEDEESEVAQGVANHVLGSVGLAKVVV